MQICKGLIQKISRFLPKGFLTLGVLSLLILPFTANAEEIVIWELDNFFSVEGGSSPDGPRTEFNIQPGDTITFINMGGTDHDAANQLFSLGGETFFDKEFFGSAIQAPGDSFTTDPIDLEGEIPFICFIHGESDMAGTVIVGGDPGETPTTPDGTPGPTTSPTPPPTDSNFTVTCERNFDVMANIQFLRMGFVEEMNCALILSEPEADKTIVSQKIEMPRESFLIVPPAGTTDANGVFNFRILSATPGLNIAWIAFGVLEEDNTSVTFNKEAFRRGQASGFIAISAPGGALSQ